MKILGAPALKDVLRTFGIERIGAPDLSAANQTATVQRFEVHLSTEGGLDLFTKIEFSRRGLDTPFRPESVAAAVLGRYRLGPLIVPHNLPGAAIRQKVRALASRRQVEARDIFDLYALNTQPEVADPKVWSQVESAHLAEARERIFAVSFPEYRDKVVAFLQPEDQETHDSEAMWNEIRLQVDRLITEGVKARGRAKKGGRS